MQEADMTNAEQFPTTDTFREFMPPSPQNERAPGLSYHLFWERIYSLTGNSFYPTQYSAYFDIRTVIV